MNDVKVKNVKVIFTEPDNIRLVIVKIDTDQPGLYGVGCATFTQRPTPVKAAIEDYLAPFIEGKNVNDIEDIWASSYVSSYWRNGPVLNNALSGIDQALWDIKGKLANMPVYDLLGGRSREAAPVYVHASGAVSYTHLTLVLNNMENHLKVSFTENQDYLLILEEYLSQFHI